MLALAGLVVVGGIVALFLMMRDDEPATPTPEARPAPTAEPAGDAGAAAPVVIARPRNPVVPLRRPTATTGSEPTGGGAPAPTLDSEPPADAKPRHEIPAIHKALNEQIWETETWIAECNERALKTGAKLSGVAAYSFTLKRQGTKVVVDTTGVEYSTIPDASVSDCMRDVSKRFAIDASALPDGVDTIVGYRKVLLDNGVLKENWLTEYHPFRPAPAP